jgi:23S rRNA (adenine2503-C2)-methyltransferase
VPTQINICDLTKNQLIHWLVVHGEKAFHAAQIQRWIWQRQVDNFHQMTDLSKLLREQLSQNFYIGRLPLLKEEYSKDQTRKFLFQLADGHTIETVLIPDENHSTLCISSQVGCALGCRFCLTGQSGLIRNLTCGEILAQIREVRHLMTAPKQLKNIVFMGMGEPLANFDAVTSALETITDHDTGLAFARRRVTLSTAGMAPQIERFGKIADVNLAISLNAPDNEIRNYLMPLNKTYSIETLVEACRRFPLRPGRRITIEYILIKGINDSVDHARQLAKVLHPLKVKINLILFNPFEGSPFERPDDRDILAFQKILKQKNYTVLIRRSRGRDISAACGQLRVSTHP